MALSHLNCTTKERRIEIVTNYVVHADDCICLYGGQTVRSDANNRIISDRYYQFSCSDRKNGDKYVILCGSGAARHFCSLIGESLPSAFSPFVGEAHPGGEGYGGGEAVEWNATRRLLYYAIRLFIVRYQKNLSPGTKIFRLLRSIEDSYISVQPQRFHFEDFSSIVDAFHTNIPRVVEELGRYGHVRSFNFQPLVQYMTEEMGMVDNIFIPTHNT